MRNAARGTANDHGGSELRVGIQFQTILNHMCILLIPSGLSVSDHETAVVVEWSRFISSSLMK